MGTNTHGCSGAEKGMMLIATAWKGEQCYSCVQDLVYPFIVSVLANCCFLTYV